MGACCVPERKFSHLHWPCSSTAWAKHRGLPTLPGWWFQAYSGSKPLHSILEQEAIPEHWGFLVLPGCLTPNHGTYSFHISETQGNWTHLCLTDMADKLTWFKCTFREGNDTLADGHLPEEDLNHVSSPPMPFQSHSSGDSPRNACWIPLGIQTRFRVFPQSRCIFPAETWALTEVTMNFEVPFHLKCC